MESFVDTNNENNSSMLNNSEKIYLNKSFNKYLPEKPEENRNQRAKIDNKTHNSTKDTKNNANSNINSTFQKTFSLFNESNYDSNSQTDRSSKNLKEIKVNISAKQRKNNSTNNQNQNLSYNDNNINDFQPLNMAYLSEDKLSKIFFIQKWWKKFYKIIIIQKYLRGFLIRKNMAKIIFFIKSIFKIIFKLIIDNIKQNIQRENKNNILSNIYNTELKKNNNKNKKIGSNNILSNNMKLNYHPSFNASNKICLNRKIEELKKVGNKKIKKDNFLKFGNNNPINVNSLNNQNILINSSNKFLNKNKNNKIFKKNNKNGKEKEKEINKISNKDKLIANNIFNIYNDVKKYYENENSNNSNHNNNFIDSNYSTANNFFNKNKKNTLVGKTNKSKNKNLKKMVTRGSMKNINEKIIINKNNNINVNININNNSKTDRINREKDNNPNKNEINSILYLLKLKKSFLFWSSLIIKKKILQKLKIIKCINTPSNTKKTLPIYKIKDKGKEKTISIKTKKINVSNSLISIKLDKITPQKLKMKSNNKIKNTIINNYSKKINKHSISVENNNSMINLNPPKSVLNSSFNNDKNNKKQSHNNNKYSNNIFNNSVIVVSQYDRNNEIKNKSEKNNKNNCINETKKLYYFYAIINLIDKHNTRKIIKKYFYIWKSNIKFSRSFINSSGIEEKIISFKNIKSPLKNNLNNKNNSLFPNNSSNNFNCQTEAGREPRFGHGKSNTMINHQDLLTPNPLEKTNHPNLFKSNIKSSQLVYQKKLLVQKKMRNQSMQSININEVEEDRNMTLINNNHDMNFDNQTTGNNFYNLNTFINNNNDFNNSQFFMRINNFENNIGKGQEGRIKRMKGIEETEIFFNPNQANTMKNSFIAGRNNSNEEERFISNKINVNVVENYRKIDLKNNGNNNNRYMNNNDKNRITTKQIILGDKNKRSKNYSHSQEFRNNNQSF